MPIKNKPAFLIAAPKSNSGKTIITLGLIKALVNKGLEVQPYKCGPDYIDPMHHTKIAGNKSYNLDLWMSSKEHIKHTFDTHLSDKDVAIVEGVMGLFDGAKKDQGSSAAVAMLLDIPIILIVDASSTAYSVAPLLYGFKNFNKKIRLAGVIFNKVAGSSHYQFLKEAAIDAGVPSLGYVPRDKELAIESRHLGLHLPGEQNMEIVERAAQLIEQNISINDLLNSGSMTCGTAEKKIEKAKTKKKLKIALAHDEAFNFSYPANADMLASIGDISLFSPLRDKSLPPADLVWLPGGYPELFAHQLGKNKEMIKAIGQHIENGKALMAECGGMMYLGKELITKEGERFEMAGAFSYSTSFDPMKLHLGYRETEIEGQSIKGHEFHYSHLLEYIEGQKYTVKTARGQAIEMPVFRYKNCWASYMHVYLGEREKMLAFLKHLNIETETNDKK